MSVLVGPADRAAAITVDVAVLQLRGRGFVRHRGRLQIRLSLV